MGRTLNENDCNMDIKHHFIEKGQGDPLILLHGNGENCDYFVGQIDAFSRYYHVYALDTRGHGKTPRGEAPFTIRQFADDLLSFMDEHDIGKAKRRHGMPNTSSTRKDPVEDAGHGRNQGHDQGEAHPPHCKPHSGFPSRLHRRRSLHREQMPGCVQPGRVGVPGK